MRQPISLDLDLLPRNKNSNGQQWTRVSAPAAVLLAVTTLAANNVWAAGAQVGHGSVIEHWNGTTWNLVASPNTGDTTLLNSIRAISPTDIWAAGCNACGDAGNNPALIEHWDGRTWSVNPAPIQFGAFLQIPCSRSR